MTNPPVGLVEAIRAKLELVPDTDSMGQDVRFAFDAEMVQAALHAVLGLHKPFKPYASAPRFLCEVCVQDVNMEYGEPVIVYEPYPCPTVRAIAEKLGVEAP